MLISVSVCAIEKDFKEETRLPRNVVDPLLSELSTLFKDIAADDLTLLRDALLATGSFKDSFLAQMRLKAALDDPYTFDNWQEILAALKDHEICTASVLEMIRADDGTNDSIIEEIQNSAKGFYDVDA